MKSWCNYGKDRLNGFKWEDSYTQMLLFIQCDKKKKKSN